MSDSSSQGFRITNITSNTEHAITGQTTIGRGKDCGVHIQSSSVSRKHGMFELADGKLSYSDLGSSNGSYVNGQKIESATVLFNGDQLVLGEFQFAVHCPYNRDAAPASAMDDDDATQLMAPAKAEAPAEAAAAPPAPEPAKAPEPATAPEPAKAPEPKAPAAAAPPSEPPKAPPPPPPTPAGSSDIPAMWSDNAGLESSSSTQFFVAGKGGAEAEEPVESEVPRFSSVPRFLGLSSEVKGMSYELGGEAAAGDSRTWKIGRDSECNIVLNHPSVSGQHAQLINEGPRWKIVNWMSTNGVYVNGNRGLSTYLQPGDRVRMGSIELVFQLPESAASGGAQAKGGGFFSRLFGGLFGKK